MAIKHTLKGKVTDTVLGTPVPNAMVKVVGSAGGDFGKTTFTDKHGKYELKDLDAGRILVEVSLAYAPLEKDATIQPNAAHNTLDFELTKS